GILNETGHQTALSLNDLDLLCRAAGFQVIEKKRFMFSPIGFPAERFLERALGPFGLKWIMANQLLVARKDE
ncbi:MAG TPA: hypothetical protein VKZ59_15860, partial [Acidobacteriota bacterium]|nr:hypothetical protein [Acidobacteriota bacterium]